MSSSNGAGVCRSTELLLMVGAIIGLAPCGEPKPEPAGTLNDSILAFARERLGEKVGRGECTDLVVAAFEACGARRFPPFGRDADFVWGQPVDDRDEVRPGDILQFRDAIFKGRRRVFRRGQTVIEFWKRSFPHHTAIVAGVRDKGRTLLILHQNSGSADTPEDERKSVHEDVLRLRELTSGTVKVYRPIPR